MHLKFRSIQCITVAMLVATLFSESHAKTIPRAKATKDVVTSMYDATTLPSGVVVKETNAGDYAYNQLLSSFNWSDSTLYQIAHALPASKNCAGLVSNQAYIIHVAEWKVNSSDSTLSLISSNWYAYRQHDANNVAQVKDKPNKQPLLYAVKQALFVGLNFFDDDVDAKKLKVSYKVTATEAKADNVVALGQLIAAVMGLTVPAAGGETPNNTRLLVAAGCKTGAENLPFDFNVSFSLTAPDKSSNGGAGDTSESDQQHQQSQDTIRNEGGTASQGAGGQKPQNGANDTSGNTTPSKPSDNTKKAADNNVVDCSATGSKKPCTFTRTFRSDDIEWWDVSIGVTIPGVREAKYTDTGNTVQRNVTTHTELYGLFDIYPTAKWKTKESWVPHFNLGIPLTSQPFYRPYFRSGGEFYGLDYVRETWVPFSDEFLCRHR